MNSKKTLSALVISTLLYLGVTSCNKMEQPQTAQQKTSTLILESKLIGILKYISVEDKYTSIIIPWSHTDDSDIYAMKFDNSHIAYLVDSSNNGESEGIWHLDKWNLNDYGAKDSLANANNYEDILLLQDAGVWISELTDSTFKYVTDDDDEYSLIKI